MQDKQYLSPEEREALKKEIFASLHCALPGTVVSFDAERQTAVIQPAVKLGSMMFPQLPDVPVFMPVPFEVHSAGADRPAGSGLIRASARRMSPLLQLSNSRSHRGNGCLVTAIGSGVKKPCIV